MSGDWDARELQRIDLARELQLAPLRRDGVTLASPTVMWHVAAGAQLFVRAYYGTQARWYRTAMAQGRGLLLAGGIERDVRFEAAPPEVATVVDEAYTAKYRGAAHLDAMLGARAAAATVRILPA